MEATVTKIKHIHARQVSGHCFKTDCLAVLLRVPLTEESAAKNSLLARLLKGMGEEERRTKVCRAEAMYGSIFDVSAIKRGREHILKLSFEYPACCGDYLEQAVCFLRELLPERLFVRPEAFAREQRNLLEDIRGLRDQKDLYAQQRCLEELFLEEGFGVPEKGKTETVALLTAEEIEVYYKTLMRDGVWDFFYIGGRTYRKVEETALTFFPELTRERELQGKYTTHWQNRHRLVTEYYEAAQAKLIAAYSVDCKNDLHQICAAMMLNEILGGNGASRLFQKVREEENLCYSVSSSFYPFLSVILVEAGVEANALEKTSGLIQKEIEAIQNNGVEEEELEFARLSLIRRYLEIQDSTWMKQQFYIHQSLLKMCWEPEDYISCFEKMTTEDLKQIAVSMKEQLIYYLSSRKGGNQHAGNQ